MQEIVSEIIHNFDVVGVIVMIASLVPIAKIISVLPAGWILKKWQIMGLFVILFIGGYMHIIYQHRFGGGVFSEEVVLFILLFGSIFVFMISTLSLQTTYDILRIDKLEHENTTDPLIGIKNRRYLDYKLKEEFSRCKRYRDVQMAVLMIDIDHFKNVNDNFGHDAGDEVLKSVGQGIDACVREYDCVARYGGEEIVVICPSTNEKDAFILAERIRQYIETLAVCNSEKYSDISDLRITVSIGVAGYSFEFKEADRIVKNADTAMYRAKNEGRNRVVVYDESISIK